MPAGQLIFVPSYFDYVRLRNLMKSEASDSLVGLCEYTEHSDAARGRTYFLQVDDDSTSPLLESPIPYPQIAVSPP